MADKANLYTDFVVKLGSKLFAGITSFDFQTAVNMIPTTDMNTAANESTFKPGRRTRTGSMEGLHKPGESPTLETYIELETLISTEASAELYVADSSTAGTYKTYDVYVSNLSKKAADGDTVKISASFQVTGGVKTSGVHS